MINLFKLSVVRTCFLFLIVVCLIKSVDGIMSDVSNGKLLTQKMDDPSTYTVSNYSDLCTAIINLNDPSSSVTTILIQVDLITLLGPLPVINTPKIGLIKSSSSNQVTINGYDGSNNHRGFIILGGTVTLANLLIQYCNNEASSGCLGAGGGLLIAGPIPQSVYANNNNNAPVVTLTNMAFQNCKAIGGSWPIDKGGQGGYGGIIGETAMPGNPGDGYVNSGTQYFGSAHCFGLIGLGGNGGPAGAGTGCVAGYSGYGAGSSGGGGGGGIVSDDWLPGGTGGDAGIAGFGGGQGGKGEAGAALTGGWGGGCGGGAGFGGAIFLMGNAQVTFNAGSTYQGNGLIQNNSVQEGTAWRGSSGYAAGSGMFLQGAGCLSFRADYSIVDDITDEKGSGCPAVVSTKGPDNLLTGGGDGAWSINLTAGATLTFSGNVQLNGDSDISGTLDVSNSMLSVPQKKVSFGDITLEDNSTLTVYPSLDTSPSPLPAWNCVTCNNLNVRNNTTFNLDCSCPLIVLGQLSLGQGNTININLYSNNFSMGKSYPLILFKSITGSPKTININGQPSGTDFNVNVTATTITVTKNASKKLVKRSK